MTARRAIPLWTAAAGVMTVAVFAFFTHRAAVDHVRYMSGTDDASPNCLPCHVYPRQTGPLARLWHREYLSPLDIAVSPDGSRLYITAEESGELLVADVETRRVVNRIAAGMQPHSVVLSRDGETAYVTDRRSGTVVVVDLSVAAVTDTVPVGASPAGLALGPGAQFLYVANSDADDISVIDLSMGAERKRLAAGKHPYAVRLAPDGGAVFVTNRLAKPAPFRSPPAAEITVVDTRTQRVVERRTMESAHLIEGIDFTPDGALALTTLVRPKNLLPATQITRGWMMTFGIGIVDRTAPARSAQLLLDDVNAFYADPYDIAVAPDGRTAFISHAGADVITAVNLDALRPLVAGASAESLAVFADHLGLSRRYVLKRIPTGANPKGLALSPDGNWVYVAERLADRVGIIDARTLEPAGAIALGNGEKTSMVRRGQQLFHNAGHSFQGQFSCRTCHPEGHTDALSYDLEPDGIGDNIVNNISLRDLGNTAPYKWTGKNVSLYRQCGFRFAKWLTRTEPFAEGDLHALVAYILSLRHPPNRYAPVSADLTPAQQRGQAIFERTTTNDGRVIPPDNRCVTCHPPPRFTNRSMADVGTAGPTDTQSEFDTPVLDNLYDSGPYLHDGRAATLEEIWTKYNPDDRHGAANDLTKLQLNDLIEYLKTIGPSRGGEER